jgi:hypothetical protein
MHLVPAVQVVLLAIMTILFVLNRLARARPHVAWLQAFRLPERYLSEEQKLARRRAGNRMAAVELMLLALVLPIVYVGSTVMFFSDIKPVTLALVGACSAFLLGLGIWLLVRNR